MASGEVSSPNIDPGKVALQKAIRAGVFLLFYFVTAQMAGWVLGGLGNPLLSGTLLILLVGIAANALCLRIFEGRPLADCGLWLNGCSGSNLLLGLGGGAAAATAALAPPLLAGAAHFVSLPAEPPSVGTFAFVIAMLAAGAFGEELIFRGYGLQVLIAGLGSWATILPVGVLFGVVHATNPAATPLSSAITAGFGILFGYAYLRSRDLWLPIGLHFGWNFTLPLFGANISGLRIRVTGYEMSWTAGSVWSGGEYGPEASLLTVVVLVLLWVYIWKLPVRRQVSPLIDPPEIDPPQEGAVCETSRPLPS